MAKQLHEAKVHGEAVEARVHELLAETAECRSR